MFYFFIITCFLTLLAAIDFFYLKAPGRIELLVLYYFLTGFFWYRYERRKSRIDILPVFWRSDLSWGKIIIFVLWPLASMRRGYDYFKRRKRHDRFEVLSEKEKANMDNDFELAELKHNYFENWSAALQYALSEANRLGQDTTIFDHAKIRKMRFKDELSAAMYEISPDGKVRKCFSFWR